MKGYKSFKLNSQNRGLSNFFADTFPDEENCILWSKQDLGVLGVQETRQEQPVSRLEILYLFIFAFSVGIASCCLTIVPHAKQRLETFVYNQIFLAAGRQ